jgi:hypothetical protein
VDFSQELFFGENYYLSAATETLAKSPNAKIIVIGNSKNGLPLIMGQE